MLSGKQSHFKPFKNSTTFHSRMGPCQDDEKGKESGPLSVRELFCSCEFCAPPFYNFEKCVMQPTMGFARNVLSSRLPDAPARATTRGQSLTTFAEELKSGDFHAVRVALDQLEFEGGFWLAQLISDFYLASADTIHGGETFKKGSLLVKINWLQFISSSADGTRMYDLLAEEKVISVMAIIRIKKVVVKKQNTHLALSEDEQRRINCSV